MACLHAETGLVVALTLAWTGESDQQVSSYAQVVSSAGDVDGDGYDDVIVGAPDYTNVEGFEGRAFLYRGSATGLESVAAWTAEPDQPLASFGRSVASADVNGDGFSDLLVGATFYDHPEVQEGKAFLYLGSPAGPSASADWKVESDQSGAALGMVANAGDVNGDGFDDVIVGTPGFDGEVLDEGRADLYLGGPDGLSTVPSWTATSGQSGSNFGSGACGGDVNGDGFDDVVVSAWTYDGGSEDEGKVFLFLGSATGPETTASWTAQSNQAYAWLGDSVAMGDVNADGYDDLVVGVSSYDNLQDDVGRVLLFLGSSAGLPANPSWSLTPPVAGQLFGTVVALPGDLNGDGYGDLVASATGYDGGQTDEGRVLLYLGSATVPASTPAWAAESDQSSSMFGWAVAGAGDVNGDAHPDLIVGAARYDGTVPDEGRAYLYLGIGTDPPHPPLDTADTGTQAEEPGRGGISSSGPCATANAGYAAWLPLWVGLALRRATRRATRRGATPTPPAGT